jgi:hypothetical protein
MKQSFLNSIKISALTLIIGLGVSAVSAWTAPTVNPPATGTVKSPSGDTAKPVAAAINLSIFDQIKRGGITVNTQKPPATADGKLVSPLSFFKKVLLPNVDTSVYIGGASFADPSFASSFPGNRDVPMTINLTGRAKINDAILFKTDAACAQPTKIINSSASAFEFWNTAKGENADLLANGIRLDGGNPAAGKILISVDGDGRAVWATPKLAANGTDIIFDTYSDSPVGICGTPQSCPAGTTGTYPNCVIPPTDLCLNLPGVQTTTPLHMVRNKIGICTCTDNYYLSDSDDLSFGVDDMCVYTPPSGSGFDLGCFTSDTKITLADGTKKNIQDIAVGDKLKALDGSNTVQALLRPKLGNQSVYSINNGRQFFTANHPFLTTDGWKSIDPVTTKKEIPDLVVTRMTIGDVLITDHGYEIIRSLVPVTAVMNTQLYNFELDGDHTYYADGYVVHNKQNYTGPISCSSNSQCSMYVNAYCNLGKCIQTEVCNSDLDCKTGPTFNGLQLVNGKCTVATTNNNGAPNVNYIKYCKYD